MAHHLGEFVGAHPPDHIFIDQDYRRLAASAHTAAHFEGDFAIGRGLSRLDAEDLLGLFEQLGGAADIAGRAHAKLYRVAAARLGGEE